MKRTSTLFLLLFILVSLSRCKEGDKFYANTMRSDVFYQLYDENKYDFLWVFDNSGSMATRRNFVKDNLQGFLNILNSRKAIDYQMAITTTDEIAFDGALVASPGGMKIVKSATSANPIADFASIINNVTTIPGNDSSFWEQGLESSYQAILKHGSEFMRTGVPLIVVYLTDANDYSCQSNCYGIEPEHNANWNAFPTSRYINFFQTIKANENSEVALFPITGIGDNACLVETDSQTGQNLNGYRYMEVQAAIGGIGKSASICDAALKDSYEGIARTIADRSAKFTLANKANGTGITVYVDGVLIPYSPENYTFDSASNSIIFTGVAPKKGAIIEVSYNQ